jgi:hypothetical protein
MRGELPVLNDWKFWVLLVCSAGTLALLYVNSGLAGENRDSLREVSERQAYINDTIRFSNFSTQFIQSLAQLAARTGDADLRKVLADHGVTFSLDEEASPDAAAAGQSGEPQGVDQTAQEVEE